MKHTNRVLSAVLAAVMLVLAFPVIVLPVSAAEPAAQEVTYMDYKDMYVQDGLTILLDAYDPSNVDFANQTWASEVGSVVATIKGGAYNAETNKLGWVAGSKGISWTQKASVSTSNKLANGVYFDIANLPAGEFTVENVIVYQGVTNDDGTGWATVWSDGSEESKAVYAGSNTAGQYGVVVDDAFAYGIVRNIAFINYAHTTYKKGVENAADSNKRSTRWYYTGMLYGQHSTTMTAKLDFDGDGVVDTWTYGIALSSDERVASIGLNDIFTYATTYDYVDGNTYDTAASATATNWHNGVAVGTKTVNKGAINGGIGTKEEYTCPYANTLLPNDAGYTRTKVSDGAITAFASYMDSNKIFNVMKGVAGSIYSIRVYDKVLAESEMAMNHLADLCAYYEIKVPVLFGNFTYATVAEAYKAVALGSLDEAGVAALQAAIDGYATSLDYAQLYAQDGLNLLLMAYNESVSTANVANGYWVNLVGAQNGTIVDNHASVSWVANDAANGGGISYYYKSVNEYDTTPSALGLTLPATTIGNGDATVEAVFIPHYITDENGVLIPHTNSNGGTYGRYHGQHSSFTLGEVNVPYFQPSVYNNKTADAPEYTGSSAGFRLHTGIGGGTEAIGSIGKVAYDNHKLLGNFVVVDEGSHNFVVSDKTSASDATVINKYVKDTLVKDTTAMVITRDVNDDNTFSASVTMNVVNNVSKDFPAEEKATIDQCKYPFDMFYNFAATVYAIRAYDRVLGADEIARNRVVDVFAKNGVDVSGLVALSETNRNAILTVCVPDVSYTMPKADAQEVLDTALATTFIPDQSKDAYSDLYVQDGLSALYTAFDGGDKTVDLATGIWYATGSNQFITLKGDKWEKSNGGIGYRMLKNEWNANTSSDYIDLGALTSNEFTVEVAQTLLGLTDEDGNRVEVDGNVETGYKWGMYATKYSSYEFGYFKGTSFVGYVNTAGGGNLATRVSFNPGHWGSDNGKYWIGGANLSWADAKYATVPTTIAFTQAAGTFTLENTPVYTHASRENVPEGETFGKIEGVTYSHTLPGYKLSVLLNGEVATSADTVTGASDTRFGRPVTYEDENGVEQTGYIPYLSASEANASSIGKPMKVMSSMPGDVYAIRIYDRALSAEEAEWNSLVDIAAYVGANVDALAGIGDAQKASLGAAAAAANLSYASTADEVEAAIAQGLAYLATYAPTALGRQKGNDGTSLRIWATANLTTVQGASKLGMEIKVTGDAEKVLSGETDRVFRTVKSGEDVVCPEVADTFYFAAVVEGIPEDQSFTFVITPYAVVDGAKVYGESVTLEWPAVE